MATKPIKFLELHYTMTQFLITDDIRRPIWYPSSDFISTEGKPKNEQTFTLNFKLVKENQRRLFAEASDG